MLKCTSTISLFSRAFGAVSEELERDGFKSSGLIAETLIDFLNLFYGVEAALEYVFNVFVLYKGVSRAVA